MIITADAINSDFIIILTLIVIYYPFIVILIYHLTGFYFLPKYYFILN